MEDVSFSEPRIEIAVGKWHIPFKSFHVLPSHYVEKTQTDAQSVCFLYFENRVLRIKMGIKERHVCSQTLREFEDLFTLSLEL
jgi:hypothetical protein